VNTAVSTLNRHLLGCYNERLAASSKTRAAALRKRLTAFRNELAGLKDGDADALHRARVATRRLRELVPLLHLTPGDSEPLTRRLRKTTRRFGRLRELDVLTRLVEELRAREIYSSKALDLMTAAFARERALLKQRMKTKLTPAKLRRLSARLEDAARHMETADASAIPRNHDRSDRGWRWALEARVARRSTQLRGAVDLTGPLYRRAELHDVRIAVKKLRYALELWQETGRGGASADLRTLKASQDLLGRLHDLEVLIEWVRDAQASFAPPDLSTWRVFGVLVRDLENECRRLHAHYITNRSKLLKVCERTAERPESLAPSRAAVS